MSEIGRQVIAYHFCQADNSPTCNVPEFIHSVAAQLSQVWFILKTYIYQNDYIKRK